MPKGFITVTMPGSEQRKFEKWMRGLSSKNDRDLATLIYSTALKIDRRAKMLAPVDMGLLRASIRPRFWREGNCFYGSVMANRHYAPYQEFGTRPRAIIPGDAGEFGIDPGDYKVSKPKRLTNVRPNPFLLPAARIGIKEYYAGLNKLGFKKR